MFFLRVVSPLLPEQNMACRPLVKQQLNSTIEDDDNEEQRGN
jgi:hypothetical protein